MKIKDLQALILEAYKEVLSESLWQELEEADTEPQPEEPGEEKGAVLEDATDTMLSKFPTLRHAIEKLQSKEYKEFVDHIDWISPRPTSFRINLKNGQDYILKWMGEGFEAQIMGKRYYLNNLPEYQQALDKLAILYREAPMKGAGEAEPVDTSTDGGGGSFPGAEGETTPPETGAETPVPGEEPAAGGEDLSAEPIDFEKGTEPK